ncbi:MAG: hypothetical protein ACOCQX_03100 [Candidatus Nanoarchaeia archaeon]
MDNPFQKKEEPKKDSTQAVQEENPNMLKDVMRRLRQLEERYSNLRKSLHVTEQNMLAQGKKNNSDKKALEEDIAELKKHVRNMGEELKIVTKELGNNVKKEDVKMLEKYISFWEPLKFVTHNELQKEVKEAVQRELKKS